jgi:hypothetical protein
VLVGVSLVQPKIQSIAVSGGTVTIRFTAGSADTASMFTLVSAGNVNGGYSSASGANITLLGPGSFQATALAPSPAQFYRIRR